MNNFFRELGGVTVFSLKVLGTLFQTKGNLRPIMEQVWRISTRSAPVIATSGAFVGAILVMQFSEMLALFDAHRFLGGLNTSALIREVGPLIISFLLAGKIGAYTAAELGTMRVTEQIDAIECLGTNSIQYLVIPRFFGIILSSVILLAISLVLSVAGSILVVNLTQGMNVYQYAMSIPHFTDLSTFLWGFFRCFVYSAIVAAVSTHKGYLTTGGAKGVGKSVTGAAVYTILYIILANYLLGQLSILLETLAE